MEGSGVLLHHPLGRWLKSDQNGIEIFLMAPDSSRALWVKIRPKWD